jgi:hypothetical protein
MSSGAALDSATPSDPAHISGNDVRYTGLRPSTMRGIISSAHVNKESNIQKVEYEAQVKLPIPAASTDRLTARLCTERQF